MPRVVVTGGAGFIGSHVCRALVARGAEVIAVDNLATGAWGNVADLASSGSFETVEHDVVEGIPVEGAVDSVLHLASPASPMHYLAHPLETLAVGASGTRQALDLAHRSGARFLLTSTSEVYGDPLEHPQREEYWGHVNPIGPRSVYDEAKRYAEALTMAYHRALGVDVRIARIFNTYGPSLRPDDGRAVSSFLAAAMRGDPITVFGDGLQTRSFCYVDDLVRGILALLDGDHVGPVNLGNPDEFTVLELAKLVLEVVGSNSEIVFAPLPEDDPVRRRPDISLAKQVLGWTPDVPLSEGLRRTYEWYRGCGVGT